ncbi:hypothetical protein HaLaN_16725, partial [Haematococcus lacustris]
ALSGPRLEVAAAPATPDAGAEPGLQQLPDLSRSCSVLDEEVLLRMVQAAEEQPGPSQLVAHGMLSLDRTVLGSVLSSSDGGDEGTWIADVAAYMTQPNSAGEVKGQGQHALAVYLTSGTPLTPLQLQAIA